MKISSGDVLHILRSFGVADSVDVPRNIENLTVQNPTKFSISATFRYHKRRFVILIDQTVEDDESKLLAMVQSILPNSKGYIVKNPKSEFHTYGLPYQGKDAYLYKEDRGDVRIDVWLTQSQPEFSRSSWQKHIKSGYVSINGTVVTSPRSPVQASDDVVVDLPEKDNHANVELPIIYMDDNVIVVDKPAGVLTHAKNPLDDEFTVAKFFERYIDTDFESDRPGVVHRLDRDTSGVIIGARNKSSYEQLKKQFADREVKKIYNAVIDGHPAADKARIDIPISRSMSKPGSFMVDIDGKSAVTDYTVISKSNRYSYVELYPKTGRTHQLRVHMLHLGTPIHGDRLYGKASDRLYLHASDLTIDIPEKGLMTFSSDVPSKFKKLLQTDS